MAGAMSLAAVMMYLSALTFLQTAHSRIQKIKYTIRFQNSDKHFFLQICTKKKKILQISLHLVKVVVLNGLNDHIWAGVILEVFTGEGLIQGH